MNVHIQTGLLEHAGLLLYASGHALGMGAKLNIRLCYTGLLEQAGLLL